MGIQEEQTMTRPAFISSLVITEIEANPGITNKELAKLLDVSTVYISLLTKKLSETGDIAYTINADHIKEFYINDKSNSN